MTLRGPCMLPLMGEGRATLQLAIKNIYRPWPLRVALMAAPAAWNMATIGCGVLMLAEPDTVAKRICTRTAGNPAIQSGQTHWMQPQVTQADHGGAPTWPCA